MSSLVIGQIAGLPISLYQAAIVVDADIYANRILIINRLNADVIVNQMVDGVFRTIVPFRYSNSNDLLIGILDDDGQYNAKFVDGVQAELIDGNLVNIRP